MVRGDREGLESMEIVAAFAYSPDDRQTLKFNCCIIVLSGGQGARAALDQALGAVGLFLQHGVAEAVEAGTRLSPRGKGVRDQKGARACLR